MTLSTSEVIFALALVGVVWYLRNYIAEKAKNLATKEDVRELTHETEAIKTQFSQEAWHRQTTWTLKREWYFRFLETVGSINRALRDYYLWESHRRNFIGVTTEIDQKAKAALDRFDELNAELTTLSHVAPVVVSGKALKLLEHYSAGSQESGGPKKDALEGAESKLALFQKLAQRMILVAKADLGVEDRPTEEGE